MTEEEEEIQTQRCCDDRCFKTEGERKFAGFESGTLKGQSVQRQQRLKMFSTMSETCNGFA